MVKKDYFIIYSERLDDFIYNVEPRSAILLLMFLMSNIDSNNRIYLYGRKRTEAMTYCDCSNGQLTKFIASLCDKDIVYRISRANYFINPIIAFKGNESKRAKLIKEYSEICVYARYAKR